MRIIITLDDTKHILVKSERKLIECSSCSLREYCHSLIHEDCVSKILSNDEYTHFILLKDE